jgi:hypothetical protein
MDPPNLTFENFAVIFVTVVIDALSQTSYHRTALYVLRSGIN